MGEIQERIQRRAYLYYCERGCLSGHEEEDWLLAEKEIKGDIAKASALSSVEKAAVPAENLSVKPTKIKMEKALTRY